MNTQLRIDYLEVSNYRCFKSLTISFHPNLTVLVARNGHGKTAILDAVKISLGTFTKHFPFTAKAAFKKTDAKVSETIFLPEPSYPVSVAAFGHVNGIGCSWSREKKNAESFTTFGKTKHLIDYGKQLFDFISSLQNRPDPAPTLFEPAEDVQLPLIAYYGTNRLWSPEKPKVKEDGPITPLSQSRFQAYDTAFSPRLNYSLVKLWLQYAIQYANSKTGQLTSRGEKVKAQLESVKKAIKSVLGMEGILDIDYDFFSSDLVALLHTHETSKFKNDSAETIILPVSSMSDGIRAVFAMTADIAYRCAKLNPFLGERACEETCGIVMIDEVDLFLHPSWQQRIIGDLQRTFPNIQFIVTTHSPQVVSSVPRECVRIIEDGEVLPADIQTQGVESQDILARIFGTSPAPKNDPYVQKLQEYAKMEAAGQADSEKGKVLYQELAQHFGEQYPPLQMIEIHRKFIAKRSKSDA